MIHCGTKNLLVIAPHVKVFIRDQAIRLNDYFNNLSVMIPIAYFSEIVRKIPFIGDSFSFLDWSMKLPNENIGIKTERIRYFAAPIEIARRHNHIRVSRACLKAVLKKKSRPDIIHTHFLYLGAAGARIKEATESPLVMTVHGADVYETPFRNTYYYNEAKRIMKEADTVISVSEYNAQRLRKLGVEGNKIRIIPNGFDSTLFKIQSKTENKKLLGLPADRPVILSIGRLEKVKGHSILLHALIDLMKSNIDPILVIIGHGSLYKQLRERVQRFRMTNTVRFTGPIPHSEISSWISASDLFVLPSFQESFPTVIPEVLACGRPIIASKVGGIPEILNNKNIGATIQPGSVVQLSNAIRQALDQEWDPDYIAAHADQYSFRHLMPKIVEVFENLL